MKKLLIVFLFISIPLICSARGPVRKDSDAILRDSIEKLNKRPVMTSTDFLKLYKYERLCRYYKICKRNPTQWKFYKGWSTRVFEK